MVNILKAMTAHVSFLVLVRALNMQSTNMMKITVILCTYNRCQSLAKTFESLTASALPGWIDWEVLVVDDTRATKPGRS